MKKYHIAIIDNGIDSSKYNFNLKYDIDFTKYKINENESRYHGTTCGAIIKKYAPNAIISSLRVLNEEQVGKIEFVYNAINWCIEKKVDIINMSLGIIDFKEKKNLLELINKASNKGIIIVAAKTNKACCSYPSCFTNTIGVKSIDNLNNSDYKFFDNSIDGIDIGTVATHKLIDSNNEKIITENVNSFAAPYITAKIYNIIASKNIHDINSVKTYLHNKYLSIKENIRYFQIDWINNALIVDIVGIKKIETIKFEFEVVDIIRQVQLIEHIQDIFDTIIFIYRDNRVLDKYKNYFLKFNKNIVFIDIDYVEREEYLYIETRKKIWHNSYWKVNDLNSLTKKSEVPIIVVSDDYEVRLIENLQYLKSQFNKKNYNAMIISDNPLISMIDGNYIPNKYIGKRSILEQISYYYNADILIVGLGINDKIEKDKYGLNYCIDMYIAFKEIIYITGEKNIYVYSNNDYKKKYDVIFNIDDIKYKLKLFESILSFFCV